MASKIMELDEITNETSLNREESWGAPTFRSCDYEKEPARESKKE